MWNAYFSTESKGLDSIINAVQEGHKFGDWHEKMRAEEKPKCPICGEQLQKKESREDELGEFFYMPNCDCEEFQGFNLTITDPD